MEKLEYKNEMLIKAQNALKSSIEFYNKRYNQVDEKEQAIYVAAVVKHFELFYEMLCKFLKFYLFEKHGVETIGSRDIFRAAYAQKLINDEQLKMLLKSVDARNATVHTYDQEFAHTLCATILQLYPAMQEIIEALEFKQWKPDKKTLQN